MFTDLEVKASVKQHDFFIVAKCFRDFSSRSIHCFVVGASHNLMATSAV